jgi:hypothetical protein
MFSKKSDKIFDKLRWGGIICVENIFYTIFKQKWKIKTSIQKSQKEVFGEWLFISSLGWYSLHE